jgi:PAS domain S-box-containing protein
MHHAVAVTARSGRHPELEAEVVRQRKSIEDLESPARIPVEVSAAVAASQLEAALRANEERLRLAIGVAHIGIYTTDFETGSRNWSPEMYAIAGKAPGTIKTDDEAWDIVHPDDRARVLETHFRALDPAAKGDFYSEHRIVRPDGEVRWIAWQGRTFFRETASGRVPIRRLGACVDITERKLAEIALRLSENKFSKMFHASPHGLAITTFDEGRYLEANPAEAALTGYSRDELVGRTAIELGFYHNPDDSREIRRLLTERGTLNNYKFRLRRKSGDVRWGLLSANLIEFEGQKCLLSTVSDMTELHDAEEALRISEERLRVATEDLEKRVRSRTAALEELNESLRREISARRDVEDELRARTEELAEINNALRVILRKSREECEENTRRMAAGIHQLAFPHLEKLKLANLTGRQAAYLQLLEEALEEIASPGYTSFSDLQRKLTPSEYQVAWMIRQGKTSKQLSEILSISCRTVESHRKSIRKKLGLQHSKSNLRGHLSSLN